MKFIKFVSFSLFAVFCCITYAHENIFTWGNGSKGLKTDYSCLTFVKDLKLTEIKKELEFLTAQIEYSNLWDNPEAVDLYNDRGTLLFVSGEYEKAIHDFNNVLDFHMKSYPLNEKIVGRALWGKAWTHAFQGKQKELVEDLDILAELIGLYENCECSMCLGKYGYDLCAHYTLENIKIKYSKKSNFQHFRTNKNLRYNLQNCKFPEFNFAIDRKAQANILLCDAYCENTVDNTVKFMKTMCAIIRNTASRATLYLFIDGLGDKAKSCCRAGGFWQHCVNPMVEIAQKWKIFGIPADPYFD